MIDEAIKNAMDASVEAKRKDLTTLVCDAIENIEDVVNELRDRAFVEGSPIMASLILQALAEAAARYAVIAKMHDAQLKTLVRMQEAANEEYPEED